MSQLVKHERIETTVAKVIAALYSYIWLCIALFFSAKICVCYSLISWLTHKECRICIFKGTLKDVGLHGFVFSFM